MNVEWISIKKVKENKNNPRKIKKDAFDKLVKSIQEDPTMLEIRPIAIDDNNVAWGGNMRLKALKFLKYEKVPVVRIPSEWTLEQKKRFVVKDNVEFGEWDSKMLLDQYDAMDLSNMGLDLGSMPALREEREVEEDAFDTKKEAEKIENPVSKPGDIWQLGPHRLMCGSATEDEDVANLMDGVKADITFTDPPYNVNYSGVGKQTSNTILNDNMNDKAFQAFLDKVFESYLKCLKSKASMYVCYASRTHREFENALNVNGFKVRCQIIWAKNLASMSWADYRWKHEPILYASLGGKKTPFFSDRKQTTTWQVEPTDAELLVEARAMLENQKNGEGSVWSLSRETGYIHPTQKPLKLIEVALKNSSKVGDVVVDLFGGSGSTLMTCQQMSRACYTMELDPRYVDAIIKRWEAHTGDKAILKSER